MKAVEVLSKGPFGFSLSDSVEKSITNIAAICRGLLRCEDPKWVTRQRADPVMDALKAERRRPLRERRTYKVIDAEMQRITRERLEAATLNMSRIGL